eukprot:COSAG06_NODE_4954_length_3833_cov_4.056776_3_plen_236_part_00
MLRALLRRRPASTSPMYHPVLWPQLNNRHSPALALSTTSRAAVRSNRAAKKLAKARQFLLDEGYAERTADSILQTLEKTPGMSASVSMLRSMGDVGLRSLVVAVEEETAALDAKHEGMARLTVRVAVPHEGLGGEHALVFEGFEGDNLMDMAMEDPLLQTYIECACAGKMACSTCHVILSPEHFARIEPPVPAEDDMLDLAYGLTETSRLGCQVVLTKEMDGMTVTVPDGVNNMW